MSQDYELGKWIRAKWKTQLAFSEKLGVHQGRISKWLGDHPEGVSEEYQTKIRKLGYAGPWPREEAKEAPAGTVTREEFDRWTGRIERLEADVRALLPLALAVKDLDARVRKLEGDQGSRG